MAPISSAPDADQPHVAIFPFMAQGHTIPLIDLSKALSSRGVRVTVVTTPSNAASILAGLSSAAGINVSVVELPFSGHLGCQNTSELPSLAHHPGLVLEAARQLTGPLSDLLRSLRDSGDLPCAVVSDFFLGFTLGVCREFGVPRLVFHGMGVVSMAVCKAAWFYKPRDSDAVIDLPGLKLPFSLTLADLPSEVVKSSDQTDPVTRFIEELGEADVNSWGVLVNSFSELDAATVSFFESMYSGGARVWCVGPLSLYDAPRPSEDDLAMRWLDGIEPGKALYASFGSQSDVSDAQLEEVAHGLTESGEPFVWVVRSSTWSPPDEAKEKGLIVSGWADQRRILSHGSIGGFLSHCGWNSVLESLSAGVPILAWPMFAEQALNSKLVVEGLGAGVRVRKQPDGLVSRAVICKGVREIMGGEKGRAARERAEALGCAAKRAVAEAGSSCKTLDELIAKLRGM